MNVLYSPTSSYFSKPQQEYLIYEGDTNQHIVYWTNLNFFFYLYPSLFMIKTSSQSSSQQQSYSCAPSLSMQAPDN